MDLKRFLPTDDMVAQFEEYSKLTTEAEKEAFHERIKAEHLQKTPEEQEFAEAKVIESLTNISDRLDELTEIVRLGEIAKLISLSYVAKKYFGKTRHWLYQRINGNVVNGKPARFTPAERQKLSEAFTDIGRLANETSRKFA